MTDSNVFNLNKSEQNDPLQEVLREGARKMLAAAIEAEVASFIHHHIGLKTDEGRTELSEMIIYWSAPFKPVLVILGSKYRKYGIAAVPASNLTAA